MGLNMCVEERKRQCKYLDDHFGGKSNKDESPELLLNKTFGSYVLYRKDVNNVNNKKKIRRYEKKIERLKSEFNK
jgi:hypothetical protein